MTQADWFDSLKAILIYGAGCVAIIWAIGVIEKMFSRRPSKAKPVEPQESSIETLSSESTKSS